MFQVLRHCQAQKLFLGALQVQQLAVWPRTVEHSCLCDWAIMGKFITGRGNGQFYLKITSKILNIFSVINIDQIKIV